MRKNNNNKTNNLYINKIAKEIYSKGYAVVPDLISNSLCDTLTKKLEKSYLKYHKKYYHNVKKGIKLNSLQNKNSEKTVYNLHNKDLIWFKIFENKTVLKILDIVLKKGSYQNNEPYYLSNISARCPMKSMKPQQLHIDSLLPGVNYMITVNVIWMLEDFTKKNGATRIVPMSFKKKSYPKNNKKYRNEKIIEGKKGSVLIFNPSLWHGSSATQIDDNNRWGVALGYSRWWKKPSFDFMKNTPKKIFNKLTKKQRELLGFYSVPPKCEFTRSTRRSNYPEIPENYSLPK